MKRTYAVAALLAAVAFAAAGCGSDEDNSGTAAPSISADDVEEAFAAQIQTGGVVDLDGNSPKSISCEKGKGPVTWRCLVAPAEGGRTVVCVVTVDETTRTISKRTCGPLDN